MNFLSKKINFISEHLLLVALAIIGIFLFRFITRSADKNVLVFKRLTIICFLVTCTFILGISSFEWHYPLALWLLLLISIPPLLVQKKARWLTFSFYLILSINLLFLIPYLNINHGYTMPDGWSLKKINQTADFIYLDSQIHDNFNVASLLDGDTRTYPLRYTLLIRNLKFGDVNEYEQNNHLYLLSNNDETQVTSSTLYEIISFNPYQIGLKKDLGDGIYLYRLDKQLSNSNSSGRNF